MILSLETSTRQFSLFIKKEEKFADLKILFDITHSQGIVQSVDFLLKRIGSDVSEIKEIYAGLGPGSFTGIRVGLSFANTLAQVLNVPVGGASTLDILAYASNEWKSGIVSFIKSRKGEAFVGYYNNGNRIDDYIVLTGEELINYIKDKKPDVVVAPDYDFREVLGEQQINLDGIKIDYRYPDASCIPSLVLDRKRGSGLIKGYLKPIYVRGF